MVAAVEMALVVAEVQATVVVAGMGTVAEAVLARVAAVAVARATVVEAGLGTVAVAAG